eukprot:5012503-Karenia_brevis.AAC.1
MFATKLRRWHPMPGRRAGWSDVEADPGLWTHVPQSTKGRRALHWPEMVWALSPPVGRGPPGENAATQWRPWEVDACEAGQHPAQLAHP